jgi:cytochrome c biogenesis protein CcdA
MKTVVEKHLGVTLAFAAGAALILVLIVALDAAGAGGEFTRGVEDWTAVARSIVGVALLAGIMVDAMRWAGTQLWR